MKYEARQRKNIFNLKDEKNFDNKIFDKLRKRFAAVDYNGNSGNKEFNDILNFIKARDQK